MTGEEFRAKVREHMEGILRLNETKGRDYTRGGDDAFDNFRRHAAELGLAPEQVWAVYANKHWDAVMTFIRNIADDGYQPSEAVDGRIDDLILYLFLLREMIHEDVEDGDAAGPLPSPPWERMDHEDDPEWQMFVAFRDAGPARSMALLARNFDIDLKDANALADAYQWRGRAEAWDASNRPERKVATH